MTTEAIAKHNQFMVRYQCGLAIASVLIFFTNLDIYLSSAKIIPLEPLVYILALAGGAIPLLKFVPIEKRIFPKNLIAWCIAYTFISIFAFWLYPSTDDQLLDSKSRFWSLLFLLTTTLIFSNFHIVQRVTRWAIIGANLISTFNNIYEFFNPGIFAGLNTTGRAAGFYVNSNNSGFALLLGMILGMGVLPKKLHIYFALLTGVAIFVTFSRGALLVWIFVMIVSIFTGTFSYKSLLKLFIGTILVLILSVQAANIFSTVEIPVLSKDVVGRLDFLSSISSGASEVEDDSAAARKLVAKMGWEKFLDNPILGNGLNSSTFDVGALVEHDISTHNTYLSLMVIHGFLGALILPFLILSATYPSRAEVKNASLSFAITIFLWGFLSHGILSQRPALIMFSLIAAINQTSSQSDATKL